MKKILMLNGRFVFDNDGEVVTTSNDAAWIRALCASANALKGDKQ